MYEFSASRLAADPRDAHDGAAPRLLEPLIGIPGLKRASDTGHKALYPVSPRGMAQPFLRHVASGMTTCTCNVLQLFTIVRSVILIGQLSMSHVERTALACVILVYAMDARARAGCMIIYLLLE